MEQKQPAEALAAYKRSMELYPRRFNGLLGAARAARALGDESLARTFYQELLEVAEGGTRQPVLNEAQELCGSTEVIKPAASSASQLSRRPGLVSEPPPLLPFGAFLWQLAVECAWPGPAPAIARSA